MREILFRGKIKAKDEWVEGYYVNAEKLNCDGYEHFITDTESVSVIGENAYGATYEVIPETVGQYTGLTDKNGTKIFEGDIVHCKARLDSADMVVIYESGQFRLIPLERYNSYQPDMGYHDINCFDKIVIGNIYDNPELLEVEK